MEAFHDVIFCSSLVSLTKLDRLSFPNESFFGFSSDGVSKIPITALQWWNGYCFIHLFKRCWYHCASGDAPLVLNKIQGLLMWLGRHPWAGAIHQVSSCSSLVDVFDDLLFGTPLCSANIPHDVKLPSDRCLHSGCVTATVVAFQSYSHVCP